MDDLDDAIMTGDIRHVIDGIRTLTRSDDFHHVIDVAVDIQDMSTLWYIMEIGSTYANLDSYLLHACAKRGVPLPCDFLESRDQANRVMVEAILSADESRLVYAVDILTSPLRISNLTDYGSHDGHRIVAAGRHHDDAIVGALQEARPSLLAKVRPLLPQHLQMYV